MPVDLSSYKVANLELSSSTKFDNLVQAIQDALNALPPAQITGYPADATKFLRGDGSWPSMPWIQLGDVDLSAVSGFTAIPATYRSLKVVWKARSPVAGTLASYFTRFNTDSGANYEHNYIVGNNNIASSVYAGAQAQMIIGSTPQASGTANRFGVGEFTIPGYRDTDNHKMVIATSSVIATSAAANAQIITVCGMWLSTAAITQIDLVLTGGGTASAGSRAQLYGLL